MNKNLVFCVVNLTLPNIPLMKTPSYGKIRDSVWSYLSLVLRNTCTTVRIYKLTSNIHGYNECRNASVLLTPISLSNADESFSFITVSNPGFRSVENPMVGLSSSCCQHVGSITPAPCKEMILLKKIVSLQGAGISLVFLSDKSRAKVFVH